MPGIILLPMDKHQAERLRRAIRGQWPPMDQADFARGMGVSKSAITRYLNGERQEPAGFWPAAAFMLGYDADTFSPTDEAAA